MRGLLRFVNPTQYPIWIRILFVISLAILLPVITAFVLIENEVRDIEQENLQVYLTDWGRENSQDLTRNLNNVRVEMTSFVENPTQRNYLLRLLGFNSRVEEVILGLRAYTQNSLINTGIFSEVRLMSNQGEVFLIEGVSILGETQVSASVGDDLVDGETHQSYIAALALNEADQHWSVVEDMDGIQQVELIQIIRNADGPVGYIVGRLNRNTILEPELAGENNYIETNSYLITSVGQVFATEDYFQQALLSAQFSPYEDALTQRIGTRAYRVGDRDYLGYYTYIPDTPFALITETPLQVRFVYTLDSIYERALLIVIAFLGIGALLGGILNITITPGIMEIRNSLSAIGEGDFTLTVDGVQRQDEIGALAQTFITVREQVRSLIEDQANRIAERVRDLQATQDVIRFAVTQRDPQLLMDNVVHLIVGLFPNIYHAQIFLIDDDKIYAVLRASTGEAGRALLSRGHRLAVGGVSVIGQVTEEKRIVIARDAVVSEIHHKNEFLPETRAELAIPLRVGDRVIGALDVQSKLSDSFTEDQVNILQTMADQIAIAIENSQLYQESIRRLEEISDSNRQQTRRAWQEYINYQRQPEISSHAGVLSTENQMLRKSAVQKGEAVIGEQTDRNTIPFAVPIKLRGQTLGAVEWELPQADFSNDKVLLAQELVNRLAISLDNARLFQESQRAIERERLVNSIAAKLSGQTNIDEILEMAVREVGQALRAPQVAINLSLRKEDDENGR